MPTITERRTFQAVVFAIAGVAGVVGPAGGFGGLEGLAALFGAAPPGGVDAALRNHLRAISVGFLGYGLIMAWAAGALERGKTAFRIGVVVAVLAGLARVTGWLVDGPPGTLATLFAGVELGTFPLLFAWHARLLRRMSAAGSPRRP